MVIIQRMGVLCEQALTLAELSSKSYPDQSTAPTKHIKTASPALI
jgi:hypothetical protein